MNNKDPINPEEITQVINELNALREQNTELSQAGFELIETQAKLQSLLHNASVGIITFTSDGTVESFNIAAQHIFGYSEGEVIARKIPDLIPCPGWTDNNVGSYIEHFISSRPYSDIPLTGKHKIGFDILLHVSTSETINEDTVFFDSDEDLFAEEDPFADDYKTSNTALNKNNDLIVCFFRDITLDKKLESELEDHKHALDLAAGAITRDKNFRVTDVNDNFCRMLGRKRYEFIGEQFIQLKFGGIPHNEVKLKERRAFLALGKPWIGESCYSNSLGDKMWFTESITPFLDDQQTPYQYLSILIDITDKKKYELQLEQHRDHLQELVDLQTADLRRARDAAEAASIAKSEFLANMSHELRTPMHAILSFTNLSLKQFDPLPLDDKRADKVNKFLSNIEMSSQRLLLLLNDLLDLAKLESGKTDLNLSRNDLFLLAQQISREYLAKAQEKHIKLTINKPATSSIIFCDRDKILQVLSNLVSNAIKFSPKHKSISIDFESESIILGKRTTDSDRTQGYLFSITDQGPGIPEGELSSIFDKFIQSSKTKDGSGGTGLGLSICQEIVSIHNGKIWAEHNPEGGAIFKVFFPDKNN